MDAPAMTSPDALIDAADPSALTPEQRTIWAEQLSMYAGFLTGDRSRTDAHISDDCTIWDSVVAELANGMREFNALRAARPSGPDVPVVSRITANHPIIDVWGDTGIGRHTLVVEYANDAAPMELIRVSAAWRRRPDGAWMLVHSHEDLFPQL
ncbi:hypothetical protein [Agromyces sp. SYSU T00194]|uniref:hypothetical protein n=1 Tax=Agromyces chitinivorans TaxID=3158560 RepID=UPI00339AD334